MNLLRRGSVSAECMNPLETEELSEKVVIPKSLEARKRIDRAILNNLLFRNLDSDQKNEIVTSCLDVRARLSFVS
jgi:cAMP-dependent protein kinase regulator